jgi:hypothetical protein
VPAGSAQEGEGAARPRRRRGRSQSVPPESEVAEILAGDSEELPGASDPAAAPEKPASPEAAAEAVTDVVEELATPPAVVPEPDAPVDLAEQPSTEQEDQPVVPGTEPAAPKPRRRRAAARPAGAPTP